MVSRTLLLCVLLALHTPSHALYSTLPTLPPPHAPRAHTGLRLRGGAGGGKPGGKAGAAKAKAVEEKEEKKEEEEEATGLIAKARKNFSMVPADHESILEWLVAALLNLYVMAGAPMCNSIPALKGVLEDAKAYADKLKNNKPLSLAQKESKERADIHAEQDAEWEKFEMEMLLKQEKERKEKELAAKKKKEEDAANQEKTSTLGPYLAAIATKREALPAEPSPGGDVVMVRVRTPDGTLLSRRFELSNNLGNIYDWVDVARHDAAKQQKDTEVQHWGLAKWEYVLVQMMPRKTFDERESTLQDAGFSKSAMLVAQAKAVA